MGETFGRGVVMARDLLGQCAWHWTSVLLALGSLAKAKEDTGFSAAHATFYIAGLFFWEC